MRIVFAAVISRWPFSAGMAWHWLQFVLGFQKLGYDVVFLEEVQPDWCFTSSGKRCSYEQSVNRVLFRDIMDRFGLTTRACQLYNQGEATQGLTVNALEHAVNGADLLINMSGHARSDFILEAVKHRVYVDQDPVYTQLWHDEYGKDLNLHRHDSFFTVGVNIGTPYTSIPDCGIHWNHLLPPVVPELWPGETETRAGRFTTIASWFGYNDLLYRGQWYRSKYVEFERFASLPVRAGRELEVALKSYRADDAGIRLLQDGGWIISDAGRIDTLEKYQRFIAGSRAEIGIAQNAYVAGRSGWFSDRSSHYLACGKPVVAQATGFERVLPVGDGLLAFSSLAEAVDGVSSIERDYARHSRAARELARQVLDYAVVLPRLLEDCYATLSVSGSNVR